MISRYLKPVSSLLCFYFLLNFNLRAEGHQDISAAVKVAENVLKNTTLVKGEKAKAYNQWMYQNHIIGQGITALGEALNREDFKNYYRQNIVYFCSQKKTIKASRFMKHYLKPEHMWHCGMVAALADFQKSHPHPEALRGMKIFDDYLKTAPKIYDGSLARYKPKWKSVALQIDDIYMVSPYWVRKSQLTGDKKYLEKAINETISYHNHLWNPKEELMYCLWIEKTKKQATHFWGRGNGWFVMAITDLLDFVPEDHQKYDQLLSIYKKHMNGLIARQNSAGLWHQVLNLPSSFTETSCSAMFTYSLLKGFNKGWLSSRAKEAGLKGWNGLQTKLTSDLKLKDVCAPTDMSDDVDYFLNRPRRINDPHGIGPFLLSAAEFVRLK